MELKQATTLDTGAVDGCFSIRKHNYIEVDGQRIIIGQIERSGFYPGQFDALNNYAPEFETMAKAIWTPEIIAAWQQKQAETKK